MSAINVNITVTVSVFSLLPSLFQQALVTMSALSKAVVLCCYHVGFYKTGGMVIPAVLSMSPAVTTTLVDSGCNDGYQ